VLDTLKVSEISEKAMHDEPSSRLVLKGRKRETARHYPDTLGRAYSMVKSEKSEIFIFSQLHDAC
jgi:hypothetical protein